MRTAIVILAAILAHLAGMAQANIWEDCPNHKKVELTPFLAQQGNGVSVIVCPGGSYFWHDMEHEGYEVGQWLSLNGVNAFVLRYRVAGVKAFITHYRQLSRGNRYPDPQDDLRQAMRYIKKHWEEYGVDTTRIGVMGFSAGGHLVMSAGELFEGFDRPAFIAPVYPVVTLAEDCAHKRSRRALLGDNRQNDLVMRDSLSLERHVPDNCPPVFLINCKDDPVVDYRNSELLDSALSAHGVDHRYIQYETGGHGFGASSTKGTTECRGWKDEFLLWLKELYQESE